MESMELHKDVPKVQESACMALTSFTTVTGTIPSIVYSAETSFRGTQSRNFTKRS